MTSIGSGRLHWRSAVKPAGGLPGRRLLAVAAIAGGAFLLGAVVPGYRAHAWTLWAAYGLLALSFTFVWGHAGIFSFGQAAFFGIGAYAYGIAGLNIAPHTQETLTAVIIAMLAAASAAAILGYFMFFGNVGDVYVAIITLAVSIALLTFMSGTAGASYHIGAAQLGGYNGMVGVPPLTLPGYGPLGSSGFFVLAVLVAAACSLWLRWLLRRPFGRITAGVRENEYRCQLLGYDIRRHKLIAFVIGGGLAGLAGGVYAAWGLYVNPDVFSLQQAAVVVIWVLVGGRRSIAGAFVGVVLLEALTTSLGQSGGEYTPIILGALLIAVVLALPDGVVPALGAVARRVVPQSLSRKPAGAQLPAESPGGDEPSRTGGHLVAESLEKRFDGVVALRNVSLDLPPNSIRSLIGPNGAGKSTLFNLLVGRFSPTAGTVHLDGKDMTKLRPDQRARLGLGIKPQVPSIFSGLTVAENMWLAVYARHGQTRLAAAEASRALANIGLAAKALAPAEYLSHGEQQHLEIGMVSAARPTVILLDEPTAGMTREETLKIADLVRHLSRQATVIVIEHDMEFVRNLDEPVTMLHEGTVYMHGSIEELRNDENVLDIYLGRLTDDAQY
ncbi:MAG: ABC transporter permease subunit [Streptosporangiaceae bacterium]